MKLMKMNREGKKDKLFTLLMYVILIVFMLVCLYPVYFVVVASVSESTAVNSGKILLWPQGFHTSGYQFVFNDDSILTGYKNTLIYTIVGTLLGVSFSFAAGYALSRKDLYGKGIIMKLMVFTMYFGGGLMPTYLVVKGLGLTDTRAAIILLECISVYNIILIRSFCEGNLPDELFESARIDGCGNFRYFLQFAIPLSKAIIAVITLYLAVTYWNSYYNALVYLSDPDKKPLQLVIREMLMTSNQASDFADAELAGQYMQMIQVVKYAVIVCATAPIMCVYPFLQKYFVQGVMIGSVKG